LPPVARGLERALAAARVGVRSALGSSPISLPREECVLLPVEDSAHRVLVAVCDCFFLPGELPLLLLCPPKREVETFIANGGKMKEGRHERKEGSLDRSLGTIL
jgi:hypothetical protein